MNNNEVIFYNLKDLISFLKKESEFSLMAELCSLIGLDEENRIIYKQMQNQSINSPAHHTNKVIVYL